MGPPRPERTCEDEPDEQTAHHAAGATCIWPSPTHPARPAHDAALQPGSTRLGPHGGRTIVTPLGLNGADFTVDAPVTAGGPIPVSQDLRGRPVAEWDTSTGPFSAAGGLCATLPAMHAVLRAALEQGGPLLPGDGPHAWATSDQRSWHAGALLRSGSLAVVGTGTGAVAVAHALGGAPGMGSRHAEKALSALLQTGA